MCAVAAIFDKALGSIEAIEDHFGVARDYLAAAQFSLTRRAFCSRFGTLEGYTSNSC
jgi:hypothetical protein